MKRYVYDSIIKGITKIAGIIMVIMSTVCFLFSFFIDKVLNIPTIIFASIGILLVIIGILASLFLRLIAKWCVVFSDGKVYYQNKCLYNCNIKYKKFYISLIDPSLVIPRLCIFDGSKTISVYLTKKDVKKLVKEKYEIKFI